MNIRKTNFWKFSLFLVTAFSMMPAHAAQAPNPRSGAAATVSVASPRSTRDVRDAGVSSTHSGTTTSARSATRRTVSTTVSRAAAMPKVAAHNTSTTARSGVRSTTVSNQARPDVSSARSASTPVARSGANPRSASSAMTASRAASARATAVFDDVSKIGGGYAACREAYATCMDQFCAKANETYRRCYCSSKFTEFRDTEDALSQAKNMLLQFQDNNLNTVDKTADEVNAMYSATVGELAIKKDTSAAQSVLNEIGDLLSGKKRAEPTTGNSNGSLGVLSFDFNDDLDDIWSGGADSIFNSSQGQDLAALEGAQLYNSANSQCLKLVAESCENNAVLNMAKSSYNILITQDCNAYEKKINTQKQTVAQTVREAEKILREARLEEYRSHNSADVNECLDKVRTAITADTACGANYKKCLDYSGVYIDVNTGEPIYSPRLFELQDQIVLTGGSDVLSSNSRFDQFLDTKRMFATTALDSCRDLSEVVWQEFKRSALIEIAQAQDAKIESVKSSCVTTMSECYDTQSSALKKFDDTTAQMSGALAAYTSRAMCQDKVAACAALYAGPNDQQCQFDNNGRLTNGATCGLTALVSFVQTVDNVRVAEGCETALTNYANELCTPSASARSDIGSNQYPWQCRLMTSAALEADLRRRADLYCKDPSTGTIDENVVGETISRLIESIEADLYNVLSDACEETEGVLGIWVDPENAAGQQKEGNFYSRVFNTAAPAVAEANASERGYCLQNSVRYQCLEQDEATGGQGYAKYNATSNTCELSTEWYQAQCEIMQGYWENNMCYMM